MVPWCLHGMLVTCFGRKNWRIEHSKVLYTPVSQPCSTRPVWVPFPLHANELLRAQPKDGICTAHFFPPAEDVRTASCYDGNTWVWGRNGCRTTNCGATLYVRARVWPRTRRCSRRNYAAENGHETWGSVHPTTEQECLAFGLYIVAVRLSCYYGNTCFAFGLYIVAVRLSCTSEARATQWQILVQVAELVWSEIPGARAGIFKSPGLLRHNPGEIQTARLQTHFLTLQITKHWLSCRNLRLRGGEALRIRKLLLTFIYTRRALRFPSFTMTTSLQQGHAVHLHYITITFQYIYINKYTCITI